MVAICDAQRLKVEHDARVGRDGCTWREREHGEGILSEGNEDISAPNALPRHDGCGPRRSIPMFNIGERSQRSESAIVESAQSQEADEP